MPLVAPLSFALIFVNGLWFDPDQFAAEAHGFQSAGPDLVVNERLARPPVIGQSRNCKWTSAFKVTGYIRGGLLPVYPSM